ncbi:hypothetical protein ASD11_05230 [Aeromicrobium sp. Root495]|uniref:DUF427 domain-containing protein n=1 Tax=Aeromicrobium sp. Root495 TaxID=1736550 RepID=UPI000701286A|nr:DUF427 domain-containing protein [Aeromicrobium sp. Root495]KQY59011.1 hypothetical protein ASD11_05230 [Aeromicrobium sp. Root495]
MAPTRPVENVWDYPRPPSIEPSDEEVVVVLGGVEIARTSSSYRICETSHPPTYYLPLDAFAEGALRPVGGQTFCEWKGLASYFDLVGGDRTVPAGAWTYEQPTGAYGDLVGHVALYPGKVDGCTLDGEAVQAQEGDFYGGWITSRVTGPFKGAPGTLGW